MKKYRVLVVDDENMHRQLFAMIIKNSDEFELTGELSNAYLAPDFCKSTEVDLVLMDVVMKDGSNGLYAAEKIKEYSQNIKVLVVTSMPEVSFLKTAKKIGVDSFWYKEVEDAPLIEVMLKTMQGEHIYPDSVPTVDFGLAKNTDITDREWDVLRELAYGLSNTEIAERLDMSTNTVKFHLSSLMSKTGCISRTELVIRAAQNGLIVAIKDEK